MRVIGCIGTLHDIRLVLVACGICLLACLTMVKILLRAQAAAGRARSVWVAIGGITFGCGVWATHFISILAYRPDMPVTFDIGLTLLSFACACCGGWLALLFNVAGNLPGAVSSGVVLALAIGAMHFIGMEAWQVPGLVAFDSNEVFAAWATALVLAPAAMLCLRAGRGWPATALLFLAVTGLHFTGMAALSITRSGATVAGLATAFLAVAVSAIGLLVLVTSLGGVLVEQHLERRLLLESERFRRFADATFEGLFFMAGDAVADVNGVLCALLGRAPADIVGTDLAALVAPQCRNAVAMLLQGEGGSAEVELLTADRGRLVADMLARPLSAASKDDMVVAVRDATERKRAERRIEELAFIDPLTGLANRLRLQRRLTETLAACERNGSAMAMFCLDLDRFKTVNDLLGHHGGDCLLIEVAKRLRAITRETDTVARLGGDEFIVLQASAHQPDDARALADRLLADLAQPYLIDGRAMEVSASIGIALYPAHSAEATVLLKQADLALYRAKQAGRCTWRFFEQSMDSPLRARREMEQELRVALLKGQFHLKYQPVFDAARNTLTGYEALLRWNHPIRGSIGPGELVPLAEECGLIGNIGRWVLETACEQAADWPENITVAVNLSPAQFKQPDLTADIIAILGRTGLTPGRLELEVTEGLLIGDTGSALATMRALKQHGVRFALDDFGTGYSSLSYLRRFPFDRLKIDRSFVQELGTDTGAEAIVRCIIGMAESLGMAVTAEGVETLAQKRILRALRCGCLQGFLLGRPAPAPVFTRGNLRLVAG